MKIIVKRVCLTIIQAHPLSCPMPYRSYKAYRFYKVMISGSRYLTNTTRYLLVLQKRSGLVMRRTYSFLASFSSWYEACG